MSEKVSWASPKQFYLPNKIGSSPIWQEIDHSGNNSHLPPLVLSLNDCKSMIFFVFSAVNDDWQPHVSTAAQHDHVGPAGRRDTDTAHIAVLAVDWLTAWLMSHLVKLIPSTNRRVAKHLFLLSPDNYHCNILQRPHTVHRVYTWQNYISPGVPSWRRLISYARLAVIIFLTDWNWQGVTLTVWVWKGFKCSARAAFHTAVSQTCVRSPPAARVIEQRHHITSTKEN